MKGLRKGHFFVYTLYSEYPLFCVGRLPVYLNPPRLFTHYTPCRKKTPNRERLAHRLNTRSPPHQAEVLVFSGHFFLIDRGKSDATARIPLKSVSFVSYCSNAFTARKSYHPEGEHTQ